MNNIDLTNILKYKSAKMVSRNILTFLFVIASFAGAFAQSGKLKQANKMMKNLNYIEAIELYNQILEKNDVAEAKIKIAEAYRKIGDSGNGEFWYGQVVRLAEAEPIAKLYYGQMLQRNGKCELAREWYNQYIEATPEDLRGQYLARACDYEQELMTKGAGIYEVKHLDFNSEVDDFGPNYYQDGILFASDRDKGTFVKREHGWTGNPFLELYYTEAKETKKGEDGVCGEFVYARPEKFNKKLNSKYHEAVVTFSSGADELFFTRNNLQGGKTGKDDEGYVRLKVYTAKSLGDGKWGDLESLPFNSDEYSVAHPALSPDGQTLFFASDMPGGFGDMDIYYSKKESGRWGPPTNLGPSINTEGREVFPFMDKNNRLYFSSDGLIGLGGLDVFYTSERTEGEWEMPENPGYPLNSISDDLAVVFDDNGTCGYFSSNRSGGVGGDDIYSFKKVAVPVEIYVYDEETQEPIAGATVVEDCTGRELLTGEDGTVVIEMKINSCCNFAASMETYSDNTLEGCAEGFGSDSRVEIPLAPAVKYNLEGIVFDEGTGLPLGGATVALTNDCSGEDVPDIITDESGRFQFDLDKNCCYTVKGSKQRYLADTKDGFCTTGDEAEDFAVKLFLTPTVYGPDTDSDIRPEEPPVTTITPEPQYDEFGNEIPADEVVYDPPSTNSDVVYKSSDDALFYKADDGTLADGYIGGKLYQKGILIEDPTGAPPKAPTVGDPKPGDYIAFLLHIYYDFDQASIRPDAEPELDKLYTRLIDNPEIIVEIGSHTDARGSKSYNKRLSQRRANAVVKWLVAKGISRERLVPVGYGETMTVNGCKDFIPCSERDHQLNRRTEFRVVGCTDCVDETAKKISEQNESVIVDECQGCPF